MLNVLGSDDLVETEFCHHTFSVSPKNVLGYNEKVIMSVLIFRGHYGLTMTESF